MNDYGPAGTGKYDFIPLSLFSGVAKRFSADCAPVYSLMLNVDASKLALGRTCYESGCSCRDNEITDAMIEAEVGADKVPKSAIRWVRLYNFSDKGNLSGSFTYMGVPSSEIVKRIAFKPLV